MLFSNERRIIAQDLNHIQEKKRYFCFSKLIMKVKSLVQAIREKEKRFMSKELIYR